MVVEEKERGAPVRFIWSMGTLMSFRLLVLVSANATSINCACSMTPLICYFERRKHYSAEHCLSGHLVRSVELSLARV